MEERRCATRLSRAEELEAQSRSQEEEASAAAEEQKQRLAPWRHVSGSFGSTMQVSIK